MTAALSSETEDSVAVLCEEEGRKGLIRRDITSHQSVDTRGLIRFVIGPDGEVVPDLSQKLPGRGLWVKADRPSLDTAVKKNLFARAAKRQARAAPDLVAQVHALLRRRCLELLGLARREGQLMCGYEKIEQALKSDRPGSYPAWLIEATDGAEDGRNRLLRIIHARGLSTKVAGCFNNDELSLALGLENAIHVALIEGRRSERWSDEIGRLAGFESLRPWAQASPAAPPPSAEDV